MFRLVKIVLLTFGVIIVATSGAVYSARTQQSLRCIDAGDALLIDTFTGSYIRDSRRISDPDGPIQFKQSPPNGAYTVVFKVTRRGSEQMEEIYLRPASGQEIKLASLKMDDDRYTRLRLESSWMVLSTLNELTNKQKVNTIRLVNQQGETERTATIPEEGSPNNKTIEVHGRQFIYQTESSYYIVTLPNLTVYRFPRYPRSISLWAGTENSSPVALVEINPQTSYFWLTLIWPTENRLVSIPLGVDIQPLRISWSPDGKRLLLVFATSIDYYTFLIFDVGRFQLGSTTEQLHLITTTSFSNPSLKIMWADDIRSVFYIATDTTGRQSLIRYDIETQQRQQLITNKGTIIMYGTSQSVFVLWADPFGKPKMEQREWDGTLRRSYTMQAGLNNREDIFVSPDYRYIARLSATSGGQQTLELIPLDGRQSLILLQYPYLLTSLAWSPDSQSIAFKQMDLMGELWLQLVSVDGALIQQWQADYGSMIEWTRCD